MRKLRFSQTQIIAMGFFLIIAMGTLLLMLPISVRGAGHATFREALFTATSAACVTGLVVQDTYTFWSGFGQAVILLLIQLGGLGFMTVAVLFSLMLRRKIGIRERELLSESINSSHAGGIVRLTKKIMLATLFFEAVGAILLSFRFCPALGLGGGIWTAVFTSVSALCNAGFDLTGCLEPYSSLIPFGGDVLVNVVVMCLVTVGGIGFLVWDDFIRHKLHFRRYQLHTKIVLFVSFLLTFGGAALFFLLEGRFHGSAPLSQRILLSFFDSVTARTAGFNIADTSALSSGSKLLTVFLMFIGGSPGSTAGGIKTTTFAVLMLYSFSHIRKSKSFGIFGRRLEDGSLKKASAVFFTNLTLALMAAIAIGALHPAISLENLLFEVFSSISTAGINTGITRELLPAGQFILLFLMYCGRVGSLSFATAFSAKHPKPSVMDPVEKITIG